MGASSPIARSAARLLARQGAHLCLAGRDPLELQRIAADIRIRTHASVATLRFDALSPDLHTEFFRTAAEDGLDGLLLAVGELAEHASRASEPAVARRIVEANFAGLVALLELAAAHFEQQRRGFLVVLGSVAGERGRRGNYAYGAAKAGLATYLQGLRSRLHASGVRVVTIKPGFVDTRMTFGKGKTFLTASPDSVAKRIVASAHRGPQVVYVPWFWRPLMFVIRAIPERVFMRLPF